MPGPDVLDEPLNEALLILKAHKTLPRARLDTGDILPAAKPVRQPSESSTSTQLRVRTKGPLGSPILLTGDSALPPTPPSNSRERQDHYNVPLSGPSQDAGVMTSLASKGSGLSTPTNGRSPPTPDITPPSAAISHLRNPLPSPFTSLSSRTQSFQTAREEQWNSDDDLDSMNTRSDPYQTSTRAYVEATNALRYGDRGLGFIFEREDNDLTPTPELTRPLNVQIPSPELHVPIASPKLNGVGRQLDSRRVVSDGSVPARKALDANAMRNVTQHREKRSRTPPRQQQTPPNVDEGKRDLPFEKLESPKSVQSQRQITLTPPMDVTTSRTVSAASHVLNGSLSDMGTKRLSGVSNMSNTSTVIEAIIRIATPPSAGRSLRHVNKYRGLRNFSGSSIDMSSVSSISHSNRTSLNSVDGLPRKLSHKRGSIREKRDRDSLGSETDNTVVSSELRRPLKHHRDYSHLRPSTASSSSTAPQADTSPKIASSPHKLRKVGEFDSSPRASQLTGSTTLDTFAIAQTKDANSQPSSPSSARRALEGGPKTSPKVRYVPERVKDADSPPSSPTSACRIGEGEPRASLETLQNEKMEEDPKISPKLLQKEKPTTLPSQTDSEEKHESKHEITAEIKREIKPEGKRKGPVPEKLHLGPFPITPDPPSPRNRTASQSSVEPRTHLQPLLPPHSHSLARNARHRGASETSNASDDSRRVSFDSTSMLSDALEHIPRKSMDSRRPTIQMMDEHNPQTPSLVPPITPLSMSSMRSEAAEVSEAKAINLYPHNNHSLLVIQHGGPPEAQPNHGIPPDAIQEDVHRIGTPVQPADVQRAIDALDAMEGSLTSSPTPPPVPIATASQTEDILHLTPPHSAHAERPPQAPQLLVHPSTPPSNKQSFGEVDSPLRNPRKPPQPPAVKLIPPTPFSEIDSPLDSAGEAHGRSQAPPRRISLAQRARRYSDSFIQPILSRTGSLKRNISMTRSRPGTADEQDRRTKDHRLHPLWRPRGFWDDFSDSDSDEFWGDGELMYDDGTEHRLPQGGDTSDVRSLEHDRRGRPKAGRFDSVRRVMDGFRGSGGFLIGNSLGMERAGTNRRRHHISLPAKLQGRSSTGADANVGVPRVARVAPPSHVNDYNGATAAHLEASSHQQPRNSTLSAPHSANATQPLSLRSRSASRSRSRSGSMSLSSFPSSYSSSGHSIRKGWRRSVKFPFRIEYVGFSGLAERMREKKAEKRREDLRRSIGRGVLVTNGLA